MKLAVIGVENCDDYYFVKEKLDYVIQSNNIKELVTFEKKGICNLVIKYAKMNKFPLSKFVDIPAIENETINKADICIVFWDQNDSWVNRQIQKAYLQGKLFWIFETSVTYEIQTPEEKFIIESFDRIIKKISSTYKSWIGKSLDQFLYLYSNRINNNYLIRVLDKSYHLC